MPISMIESARPKISTVGCSRAAPATASTLSSDIETSATMICTTARPRKTLRQAVIQIIIADVSMSLDNVLAVAGAAREHPTVLIFGLALSIALMGLAASLIARLLSRHRWIAWIGLLVILYVALHMIYEGWLDVRGVEHATPPAATEAPAH